LPSPFFGIHLARAYHAMIRLEQVRGEMLERFERVDRRFAQNEQRLGRIDQRLGELTERLDALRQELVEQLELLALATTGDAALGDPATDEFDPPPPKATAGKLSPESRVPSPEPPAFAR
jgi:hypothetical protein